jgi:hypothetical protein
MECYDFASKSNKFINMTDEAISSLQGKRTKYLYRTRITRMTLIYADFVILPQGFARFAKICPAPFAEK